MEPIRAAKGWSEALIAPMSVTPAQAAYIVRTLPGGARELPSKISTIRFASVRIGDSRLFPDAFEGVLRRTSDGAFGPLVLRPLDSDGTMQLSFRPGRLPDGRESIEFRLNADRWIPPFGPRVRWNEIQATGRSSTRVESPNSRGGVFRHDRGTCTCDRRRMAITRCRTSNSSRVGTARLRPPRRRRRRHRHPCMARRR